MDASWASRMQPAAPPTTSTDSSEDELTAAGLVPRRSRYEDTGYPQVRWPWRVARKALAAMAETAPAASAVVLRHVNPRTGEWPLRTMGSEVQWLRPGERTAAERRTGSGVFHAVEGRGESLIGERSSPGKKAIASPRRPGTGSSIATPRGRARLPLPPHRRAGARRARALARGAGPAPRLSGYPLGALRPPTRSRRRGGPAASAPSSPPGRWPGDDAGGGGSSAVKSARASPMERENSASPSVERCGGDSARANPSMPSWASRVASSLPSAAVVTTTPIVVLTGRKRGGGRPRRAPPRCR